MTRRSLESRILETMEVFKKVDLDLLVEFTEETSRKAIAARISTLKDEHIIISHGTPKYREYEYKGRRDDVVSIALLKLRDCYHYVMACRLKGPQTVTDICDFFNIEESRAIQLMSNTVKRYSEFLALDTLARELRIKIK